MSLVVLYPVSAGSNFIQYNYNSGIVGGDPTVQAVTITDHASGYTYDVSTNLILSGMDLQCVIDTNTNTNTNMLTLYNVTTSGLYSVAINNFLGSFGQTATSYAQIKITQPTIVSTTLSGPRSISVTWMPASANPLSSTYIYNIHAISNSGSYETYSPQTVTTDEISGLDFSADGYNCSVDIIYVYDNNNRTFIVSSPLTTDPVYVAPDISFLVADKTVASSPQNVSATAGVNSVSLSWSAPSDDGGLPITSYKIYCLNGLTFTVSASTTSFVIYGLGQGTQLNFSVSAYNLAGESLPSSYVYATPLGSGGDPVVPCFFGNAPVLTPSGYRRMDTLRIGDKVMTPEGAEATIERVKVTRCEASPSTNPFVIPKGRFGAERRVLISPNHKVVTDTGLTEARHLGLQQEDRQGTLTYYNLELVGQAHMVVGGVAVESLAPVRRMVLTMDQFKTVLQQKYGSVTDSVMANIKRTCRFLADGRVEVPVMRK